MNIHAIEMKAAVPTTGMVELDLSVIIVTAYPVAAALLSRTDDGSDTVKGSDC